MKALESWLLLLNALMWLLFAIIVGLEWHPALPDSNFVKWTMALGALLTSGALLLLAFHVERGSRKAFFFSIGLLSLLAILTITDQFGLADTLVLAVTILPIVMLLKHRARYFSK